MSEKSTFHETKEVVSRLREPLKVKAVPYKTQKETGHQIQFEMNLSWDQIDGMLNPDGAIVQAIENMKALIEGPMQSKYLGVVKTDEAN